MLTNDNLLWESLDSKTNVKLRMYRYANGYGLAVMGRLLSSFPWSVAIFKNVSKKGIKKERATNRLELFRTEEEANAFIIKAEEFLSKLEEL